MASQLAANAWEHRRLLALLAACALAACNTNSTSSPKPQPPIMVPRPATIATSLVFHDAPEGGGTSVIVGRAGAVEPAAGFVRAYNLEGSDPASEAPVTADGGFELGMRIQEGDEVRLQVLATEQSSAPYDLVVGRLDVPLDRVVHALEGCLQLDPPRLLMLSAAAPFDLRVQNLCDDSIELAAPRPRGDVTRFEFGANLSWPLVLEREQPISVTVGAADGEAGDEEVFFVEATSPEYDRRALTVRIED